MDTDSEFAKLLTQAQSGDEEAAGRLVREYEPELRRYIRFRLTHPGVRRFLDSLDVCQSVMGAFFVHLQGGQLELVHSRQLFRLLAVMAENKIRDKVRRHKAARRGGGAEVVEAEAADAPAPDLDPAVAAAGRDLVRAVRERLTPADQLVMDRWLAGDGWPEIAADLGGTPDAVRKRVTRAVERAAQDMRLIEEPS